MGEFIIISKMVEDKDGSNEDEDSSKRKVLNNILYYLKYHHIEINEFHNDHIYNEDVNITSDPYLCSYNDECLNKDCSLG